MKPIKFNYLQEFRTDTGRIIRMKALITQRGVQSIECVEDNGVYAMSDLVAIINEP